VGEGLFHCYPACAPLFPEARQAMEEISLFVEDYLKRSDIDNESRTASMRQGLPGIQATT